MTNPTGKEIREAIAALIRPQATGAVVFPRWILGYKRVEWPGLLRALNNDRAHGWMITKRRDDGTMAKKISGRCTNRDWVFAVIGFHYYDTGNDAQNSEDLFEPETERITEAIDDGLTLALPQLQVITPLSFEIDLFPFGGEEMHVASGRIVVRPCC